MVIGNTIFGRGAPNRILPGPTTLPFVPSQSGMGYPSQPTPGGAPRMPSVWDTLQGGAKGYISNPQNIAKLGSKAFAGTSTGAAFGKAVPIIGAVMGAKGVYDAFKVGNRKSGAASGAALGASIGSIVPGLGTVIGGAIGAVAGFAAGALGHKTGKSELTWDAYKSKAGTGYASQLSDADTGDVFKGLWDTNTKTLGGVSQGDKLGFIQGMGQSLSGAVQSGALKPDSSPEEIGNYLKTWVDQSGGNSKANLSPKLWGSLGDLGQRFLQGGTVGGNRELAGAINLNQFAPQQSAFAPSGPSYAPTMGPGMSPFAFGGDWTPTPTMGVSPFESLRQRLRTGTGAYTLPNYMPGDLATPQPQKVI